MARSTTVSSQWHRQMSSAEFTDFLRKAMIAAWDYSATGSLAYYFMDWGHMTEILSAGQEVCTEFLNLFVWAKSKAAWGASIEAPMS